MNVPRVDILTWAQLIAYLLFAKSATTFGKTPSALRDGDLYHADIIPLLNHRFDIDDNDEIFILVSYYDCFS